ncbi:hypothetical protein EBX31_05520 [bacterium]|nr:hypothetical protein [bacterium]
MPYLLIAIFYLLPCLAVAAPFASWIDVKAECGAMGDGKADDTIAIQKGLDLHRDNQIATRKTPGESGDRDPRDGGGQECPPLRRTG